MNLYKVEIKSMIKTFLIWVIVMSGLLILFMAMFPSIKNNGMAELMKSEMNSIPKAMRDALGISQSIDFSDLLQYFAYCNQYILMAACIYAGMLGANSLIKEESEGTIEFLYAQPIKRSEIVIIKILSSLTLVIFFNLILFLVTIILFEAFKNQNYEYISNLTSIFKGMFLAELVFLSVGFLISTIIKKVSMATPCILSIFFTTYMLGIFSGVVEKIKWMKCLSPYHYVMPSDILSKNGILESKYVIISLIIIVISITSTFIIYNKKDFKI
ncbi:ABC-2 type transport system permease protein [Clostridium cavendishii DSM 21758]|uniref:ABC-2 type transport system permease protein n=1 Tax=Clostridium cavendishii DSM 21758 TaxID=1121302 RepID=A0A1M6IXF5_9CLOT|nr:ABC transporter permease subunit [Clostridium cavendishii]SHJ39102.1 ABC-2 type transport system permease protein [Clostridium cavendishii DSM 21758]